jgi:glycosyltransferase involved in cell wall biosynthesis
MEDFPVVSVIVPTFDRAKLLVSALRSITAQSYHAIEIIVIDDGSTDGTRDAVRSLEDARVRYFHQENRGLPAAWNAGIDRSRGQYLAFLDSDDTWLEGKLKAQTAFLENAGSNMPGCVTGYRLNTVGGRSQNIAPSAKNTRLREIMRSNILHLGTTFMCRRGVFDVVGGFDVNLRRGQDTDWLIRYRDHFELGILPERLAVFNQHLSRSGSLMEGSALYFLEKHQDALRRQGRLFHRWKTASIFRDLAYQYSREDNRVKAREYLRKSILSYPLIAPGLWLILVDVYFGTRLKRAADSLRFPGAFK